MSPTNNNFRFTVWFPTLAVCGFLFLSGCSLFEIHLTPEIKPLKEKKLKGERGAKVLLIDVDGMISNSQRTTLTGVQVEVGMVEKIREILSKAEEDDDLKALVVRINSPGGTVTSSDIIFHELTEFKKKRKVKVYSLMMDLAASGGYYIALTGDKIMAHPTTITGSIGVITVKVNLHGLMDKVGVDWEVVKSGDKKDFLSPFRALTTEEKELFQETIDSFHDRFVRLISENRPGLGSVEQVRPLADGRVYTSQQALDLKLIDFIGYLDEAEDFIKKDLDAEALKVVTYQRPGEYKSNLYSALPQSPSINLVNLNLNILPETPGPHFLYMWMP